MIVGSQSEARRVHDSALLTSPLPSCCELQRHFEGELVQLERLLEIFRRGFALHKPADWASAQAVILALSEIGQHALNLRCGLHPWQIPGIVRMVLDKLQHYDN